MTERPFNIETFYRRITRARYHARGLNSRGCKPGKKHFPDLAGLPRKEWRRRWMRITRALVNRQSSIVNSR